MKTLLYPQDELLQFELNGRFMVVFPQNFLKREAGIFRNMKMN
jgi:hypothetical protein